MLLQELSNVMTGFCGRAEEGWAGGPSHFKLEGGRDNSRDVFIGLGWVRWEHIAELVFI